MIAYTTENVTPSYCITVTNSDAKLTEFLLTVMGEGGCETPTYFFMKFH